MEAAIAAYARVHRCIHGDGNATIDRVLTTCGEMLRDRGCTRVERTAADLRAILEGPVPAMCGRGGGVDYNVFVHGEERVGVKYARAVCEEGVRAVVVSLAGPTPFTRRECRGDAVQFFTARELYVNITRHHLVPKHEVAPPPAHVDGGVEALPRLLDSDPVARYHDWPVGTVVRVLRHFGGHEPVPYYRVVVGGAGEARADGDGDEAAVGAEEASS